MKRKLIVVCFLSLLLATCIVTGAPMIKKAKVTPVQNRGVFNADLGLGDERTALITLEGNYRDFRGGHILFGTINRIDSDYSNRFQGFASRNRFFIQTAIRGNIVNIVGRFNSYDEDSHEFSGNWGGLITGHGRTRGWITAQFS